MQTFYVKTSFSISGMIAVSNRTVLADNLINATEDVPAGIAATAGAAGVMTMPTGHGVTNSDIVSVYSASGFSYNCTVSDSSVNAITVTLVDGDALPVSGAVVIAKQVEIDIAIAGTSVVALFMGGDVSLGMSLEDAGGVELIKTTAANAAYEWDSGCGETNPISGDSIIKAHVYNRGTTAGTVTIIVGYDND